MLYLEGYRLENLLYKGYDSSIYSGLRLDDDKQVIFKIHTSDFPSESQISRFQNEFNLGRRCSCLNVIDYYTFLMYEKRALIIKENFGGSALSRIIAHKRLSMAEVFSIALGLARGIEVIHSKQIIHKDINPNNILYNEATGEVKIIDFGISSELTSELPDTVNPGKLEGTLAYISPEQTGRMNRSVDCRTDFYSLGVTLYQLVTRELPFDSDDPMALVHAHIAREPEAPAKKVRTIPGVFSDLIMKLMAKNAEDRYQSARGIVNDLQMCSQAYLKDGSVPDFSLAGYDLSETLKIPEKLYGREKYIKAMYDEFEKSLKGDTRMICFSGLPGIGKSFLIKEIQKPLIRERGYFISGKFDQYERKIPYSALKSAFGDLVRQILSETEENVLSWKKRINEAAGPNGKILTDFLPNLELITGPQPELPQLSPAQTRNRFVYCFQNFVKIFARLSHPLVLFLDDLQWIDYASIFLLREILLDPDLASFLFIGAYRSNEVKESHSLMSLCRDLKHLAPGPALVVEPLAEVHINHLVCDCLGTLPDATFPLASLVYRKTGGNPFFVKEFLQGLYGEKLLTCDFEEDGRHKKWMYDLEVIEQSGITDNIVEYMISRVQKLPEDKQKVLKLASCYGSSFSLEALSGVYGRSARETFEDLKEGVNRGLLLKQGKRYRFIHDRVQEAAYLLLDEKEKCSIHHTLGNLLLNQAEQEGNARLEENIFEITGHLNKASSLLTTSEEKIRLCRLNLKAAVRARNSTAFSAALALLEETEKLLPSSCWKDEYELSLAVFQGLLEMSYLTGDSGAGDYFMQQVLENARSVLDIAGAYEVQIVHVDKSSPREAVRIAKKALAMLGVTLPGNFMLPLVLLFQVHKAWIRMGRKKIPHFLHLKKVSDPLKKALLQLTTRTIPAFYHGAPRMVPLLVIKMLDVMRNYGLSAEGAYVCAVYAVIQISYFKRIEEGVKIGEVALGISRRFNVPALKSKFLYVYNVGVSYWKQPFTEVAPLWYEGFMAGSQTGDFEYAAYHLIHYVWERNFYSARKVSQMKKDLVEYYDTIKKLQNHNITLVYEMNYQMAICLGGKTEDPLSLNGDFFNEEQARERWRKENDNTHRTIYYIKKQFLAFLYNRFDEALDYSYKIKEGLPGILGMKEGCEYLYIFSLALLSLAPEWNPKEKKKNLKQIRQNLKTLKKWSDYAPFNFEHKYLLVKALYLALSAPFEKVIVLFDRVLTLAGQRNYLIDRAIAAEAAGRYCISKKLDGFASGYLNQAFTSYQLWGAVNKVIRLKKSYAPYLELVSLDHRIEKREDQTAVGSATSTVSGSEFLDINTIMKAAGTLAGEIEMDGLLSKMMIILMENAGAQKGSLLLPDPKGKFLINVQAESAHESSIRLDEVELDEGIHICPAIIRYVAKTGEPVVLDNARLEGVFRNDPYLICAEVLSVLCLPIKRQGQVRAILYLENNLAAGVFSPKRVETLKILAAQAAVSLENAKLIENLALQQRLKKEMEIAQSIQTTLCPGAPHHDQLAITASMRPADEVGGDYYDIQFDKKQNIWLAIGDVSGHGVTPGLIMMMVKAFFAAALNAIENIDPKEAIVFINSLLFEHMIESLDVKHFMTLTLLQYLGDGRFVFAGAHLDLIVYSKKEHKCRFIPSQGAFLGFLPDISGVTENNHFTLEKGDILLLCTDGLTEARNSDTRELLGEARLAKMVEDNALYGPEKIKEAIMEETLKWSGNIIKDDMTLIVIQRKQGI